MWKQASKERNQGQTFASNFLAFSFVYPAQALLNSTPQLFARDRGAVAWGAQLGPSDLRMDAAAKAAVGAGDVGEDCFGYVR
jgi:hypothetical protein